MNIFRLGIFLFVLSALALGVGLYESGGDLTVIDASLNNVSTTINNLSLNRTVYSGGAINNIDGKYLDSFYLVIEKYVHFIGSFAVESLRIGISFGYENPEFFTPEFMLSIIKLVVFALIVSLLIKPVFYILIFLVMSLLWIIDIIKRRRSKG